MVTVFGLYHTFSGFHSESKIVFVDNLAHFIQTNGDCCDLFVTESISRRFLMQHRFTADLLHHPETTNQPPVRKYTFFPSDSSFPEAVADNLCN